MHNKNCNMHHTVSWLNYHDSSIVSGTSLENENKTLYTDKISLSKLTMPIPTNIKLKYRNAIITLHHNHWTKMQWEVQYAAYDVQHLL